MLVFLLSALMFVFSQLEHRLSLTDPSKVMTSVVESDSVIIHPSNCGEINRRRRWTIVEIWS